MDYDHFLIILQHLKEKAIEFQSQIEKTQELNDPEVERMQMNSLQKVLIISVMSMVKHLRTLLKMSLF